MPVQKILREHAELSRIMRLWVSDEGVSLCASGFPFRGQIISKRSQSNAKFIYGIKTVMASNYIENLGEEVNKGDASQSRNRRLSLFGRLKSLQAQKKSSNLEEVRGEFEAAWKNAGV